MTEYKITSAGNDIYLTFDGQTLTYSVGDVPSSITYFKNKYSVPGNIVFVDGVQVYPEIVPPVPADYTGLALVGSIVLLYLLMRKR